MSQALLKSPMEKCSLLEKEEEFRELMELEEDTSSEGIPFVEDFLEETNSFQVLSSNQVWECMTSDITSTNTVLQLNETTVRKLLNHFKWDKESLLEAYFLGDEQQQKELLQKAGIPQPTEARASAAVEAFPLPETCQVCYDKISKERSLQMECGHSFCKMCWTTHLKTQIMDKGNCDGVLCMASNCSYILDDNLVTTLIPDKNLQHRYQTLLATSYIQHNPYLKRCPAPGCTNAIKVGRLPGTASDNPKDLYTVTCRCGFVFCFSCGEQSHQLISCEMLFQWLKIVRESDAESQHWIATNTKPCPKCKANIEKTGGCHQMRCGNTNCCFEFCWRCLCEWSRGGEHYWCQSRQPPSPPPALDLSPTKQGLHIGHYNNHMVQWTKERTLLGDLRIRLENLKREGTLNWVGVEVLCLQPALEALSFCRQTLACAAVFGLFCEETKGNSQLQIFKANKEDLELAVENLTTFLEANGFWEEDGKWKDCTNAMERNKQVVSLFNYCNLRRQVLLEHVQEGYENNWWNFSSSS